MPKSLFRKIGESNPTVLIARPDGLDPVSLPLYPTPGTYAAGTLLYRMSTGFYAPAGASDAVTSNMLAVLGEEVVVEQGETVAPAVMAYRAGCFVDGAVKYDNSGTATAVTAAMKVVLREQNIVFLPIAGGAEFDNGSYTITYVANNGASPAEDDVQISAVAGDNYTILNNSDSKLGFTAPATKSFSKWNTKADGTGTDYAAAASYTVAADLTLYAVWA